MFVAAATSTGMNLDARPKEPGPPAIQASPPCTVIHRGRPAIAVVALASILGCGGGGGGGSISPSGTALAVGAPELCYTVDADEFATASLEGLTEVQAHPWGGRLWMLGVPLRAGMNELVLSTATHDGAQSESVLRVDAGEQPEPRVAVAFQPTAVSLGEASTLHYEGLDLAAEYERLFVDWDGDGSLDFEGPVGEPLEFTPSSVGIYQPLVVLRAVDGELHCSSATQRPTLKVFSTVRLDESEDQASGEGPFADLQRLAGGELWALAPAASRLVRLSRDGDVEEVVPLPGVTSASGFCADEAGNLFVTDAAQHRVVKLLRETGYAPDPSFGESGAIGAYGSGPEQLDSPADVLVVDGLDGGDPWVVVADTGNSRLQLFDSTGAHIGELRGDEFGEPQLAGPRRLEASLGLSVLVVEGASDRARLIDLTGRDHLRLQLLEAGPTGPGVIHAATPRLGGDGWIVTRGDVPLLHVFDSRGVLEWTADLAEPGSIALERESEFGVEVVVASVAGPSLRIYTVRGEPQGWGPVGVVDLVRELLLAADREALASLLDPELERELSAVFGDPSLFAQLTQDLLALGPSELVEVALPYARVETDHPEGVVEWALVQPNPDSSWRVLGF